MRHKLVILLHDGRRLKGTTDRFDPEKPFLLLRRVDLNGKTTDFIDLEMKDILAAFFVHDLALNRTSRQVNGDALPVAEYPGDPNATMVRTQFKWGEVMDGLVLDYAPEAPWFFLLPVGWLNRADNNERVYVTREAVRSVEVLSAPAAK